MTVGKLERMVLVLATTILALFAAGTSTAHHRDWGDSPSLADLNREDRHRVDAMLRADKDRADDAAREREKKQRDVMRSYNNAVAAGAGGRSGRGSSHLGELKAADERARQAGTSITREFEALSDHDKSVLMKFAEENSEQLADGVIKALAKKAIQALLYTPHGRAIVDTVWPTPLDSHPLESGDLHQILEYRQRLEDAKERASQNQCPVDIRAEVNEPRVVGVWEGNRQNHDFAVWNDPRDGSIKLCVTDDRCYVRSVTYRLGKIDISDFQKDIANSGVYADNGWVGYTLGCRVVKRGLPEIGR